MGIRADMEAKYWGALGREGAREFAEHCFECLSDPNAWMRMQAELELTDEQLVTYFDCIKWLKDNMLTKADKADKAEVDGR